MYFNNGVVAIFKPMRVRREQEALPNQMYFDIFERHTSEIGAYHLDRFVFFSNSFIQHFNLYHNYFCSSIIPLVISILRFNRAMPVVGRQINMIREILQKCKPSLQKTFFVSPKPDENLCFTGTGECIFCDVYHPICGNGTFIEVILLVNL